VTGLRLVRAFGYVLGMNLNPDRHFDLDQFDGFDGSLILATASPRWTLAIGEGFVSILFSTFSGGNDFRSRSGAHQYFLGTIVAISWYLRSSAIPPSDIYYWVSAA